MPGDKGGGPHFSGTNLDVATANIGQLNAQVANVQSFTGSISTNLQPANAYLPPGGFSKWNAALASQTGTFWGMGASLAPLGGGGTVPGVDLLTNPYGVLYRARLQKAGYNITGDTFLPAASAAYNSLVTWSVVPWVMDQTVTAWQFDGPFTMPIWNVQTTMPLCHAVHPSTALGYNARSASVWYFDVGNQDGGTSIVGRTWDATETLDSVTHSQTMLGDNLIHRVDFTNLTNKPSHNINLGNQGTAAFCMFPIAVSWYSTPTIPTTGLHFAWFGQPGSHSMGDMMRKDGTGPKLRLERLLAPNNTPTGDPPSTPFVQGTLGAPWNPKMVWIDEWDDFAFVGQSTTTASTPTFTATGAFPSDYALGMQRLLRVLRVYGSDVVNFFPAIPDSYVSDVTVGNNQQWNLWDYYMIRKQLAELNGHGWLNIDNAIGETGLGQGFWVAGNPHYTASGHSFVDAQVQSQLRL